MGSRLISLGLCHEEADRDLTSLEYKYILNMELHSMSRNTTIFRLTEDFSLCHEVLHSIDSDQQANISA